MSKVIWKDNSEPAETIGIWPFRTTLKGRAANRWEGFDGITGELIHRIRNMGIGYDVWERNGKPSAKSFLTLDQAKKYCENPTWPLLPTNKKYTLRGSKEAV